MVSSMKVNSQFQYLKIPRRIRTKKTLGNVLESFESSILRVTVTFSHEINKSISIASLK